MTEIDHSSGTPVNGNPPTTVAHVMYVMHAISPFTAWTLSVLAVIIGALTRDSVRGTYVESHYSWLLRTFMWTILWFIILVVVTFLLGITIVGLAIAWIPWVILAIWYLYRVIRGWLRLNDRLPAP